MPQSISIRDIRVRLDCILQDPEDEAVEHDQEAGAHCEQGEHYQESPKSDIEQAGRRREDEPRGKCRHENRPVIDTLVDTLGDHYAQDRHLHDDGCSHDEQGQSVLPSVLLAPLRHIARDTLDFTVGDDVLVALWRCWQDGVAVVVHDDPFAG